MVVKNAIGELLKVWTKIYDLCTPVEAKAVAILWALKFKLA